MSSSSVDMLVRLAVEIFHDKYGGSRKPTHAACAPGRVNIIGEHTDYNDGYVLPMAIDAHTVIVGSFSDNDNCCIFTNSNVENPFITFLVPSPDCPLEPDSQSSWSNYVKGVVNFFPTPLRGFNAVIVSSVPIGGGVSSSASLEVAMYTFLEALVDESHDFRAKALACQKAEHVFAGMPCGIMDQFISVMALAGHCLLIDCRDMTCQVVPLSDPDICVMIINSNVKHELTGSEYSTRRKQCEAAAGILNRSLRETSVDMLRENRALFKEAVIYKRARHVVTEILRTREAAQALQNKDFRKLGNLMIESHDSLRDDYDVSCSELDQLVDIAIGVDGVYGSRMTGGGFGGCTVAIVQRTAVDFVIKSVQEKYDGKATIFVSPAVGGARKINLASILGSECV